MKSGVRFVLYYDMLIRLLLADDHAIVRQGLRLYLGLDPAFTIVGEAANGADAVRLAQELAPDVVLMDLMMPVMSGLEATAAIRQQRPATQVIVLTSVGEQTTISAVIRAGAIGYLLKDTEADELSRAIKAAAAGQPQLSPQVAARLLAEVPSLEGLETLTDSESLVLRLAAQGLSEQEIARSLILTEPLVQTYLQGILEKVRLAETAQASLQAFSTQLHDIEKDLGRARQIQLSLLPETCPRPAGWDIAARYQAARQVGGDLYDFVEFPDAPAMLGLLIADVSGKGMPAALFMAHSRAIIHAVARRQLGPAETLREANRQIGQGNQEMLFISAFYAVLDTLSGALTFANAGHNRPIWWQARTKQSAEITTPGIVLGIADPAPFQQRQITLAAGDKLILYTDGITEAFNGAGEGFGEARLHALVAGSADLSAQATADAILDAVQSFCAGAVQADDFTLVVIASQER